jgi:hypothetical protein
MNINDFIANAINMKSRGSNKLDISSPFNFMLANGLMPKPSMRFMGIDVYESPLCTRRVPVKPHKFGKDHRRRAYHLRIEKKWNKRYGFKVENVMYMIGNNIVMMHMDDAKSLKKEAEQAFGGLRPTGVILDDVL